MTTPRVFISYSHDSQAHKDWVEELAIRLRRNGVDTTLDQWDAGPGDDLTLFMEQAVAEADRVLAVCTPKYVAKADAGKGGVGYERMIVTAELVRNIGTNKFIPIIRNASPDARTPRFLGTRVFVDFSDGQDFERAFEQLLMEMHKVPSKRKPPLGQNPFAQSPLGEEAAPQEPLQVKPLRSVEPVAVQALAGPEAAYTTSRRLVLQGAESEWQRTARGLNAETMKALRAWRKEHEQTRIGDLDTITNLLDQAVQQIAPLLSYSLAAVESGHKSFTDQSGLVFDFLGMRDWPQAGGQWFINLPTDLVYVFHNLHGAMCASTGQFDVALKLVERKVQASGLANFRRICQSHELLGWPSAFQHNALHGWQYIFGASSRWPWLTTVFQTKQTFSEALIAYWMLLNIHELVLLVQESSTTVDLAKPDNVSLDVPLTFAREDSGMTRRAFQLLLQHADRIKAIWESQNVPRAKVEAVWPQWMAVCKHWLNRSGGATWFFHGHLEHARLFEAL